MTKSLNTAILFFLYVLISFLPCGYNAQEAVQDTLKKPIADTLRAEENQELEGKVDYTGTDSMVCILSESKLLLYGNSHVNYGSMDLKSEFIEIDYKKNLVTAYGKKDSLGKDAGTPVFKEGNDEMTAEKIMYNLKTKRGKIFNALTKQGELLVQGSEIKKDSTDIIYMKDMRCIPCKEEDARTKFRATRAKIIPDDKIVTGPMYLEVGGVPTPLALPFGFFPNTKRQKNGVLLPMPGRSATKGFFLQDGGFYWGISDKTDMIIRGDIYSDGSWAVKTINDYNVLYKSIGAVSLAYSRINTGDRDIPSQFSTQTTYSVGWQHTQDNKNNPTVRFGSNVNYVNNQRLNRINSPNSNQALANTFQSNINFTKSFKIGSFSTNALHSQNTSEHKARVEFPVFTFNINRFFPFKRENAVRQNVFDKIGVNYLMEAKSILSGVDTILFEGDLQKKLSYGIRHSVPVSTNFSVFKYITVTPALNFSSVMYTSSTGKTFVHNSDTTFVRTDTINNFSGAYEGNFSTAMNTKIYFDYIFKRGRLSQVRHLMMPTLTYLYRPDFGEEQFAIWKKVQVDTLGNTTRYSIFERNIFGGPAAGMQNALSLNLFNTLDAKTKRMTDTGYVYNKISLLQETSLSGSYNFAADSFHMSDIRLSARTKIFKRFDVQGSASYDPYAYDKIANRRLPKFSYDNGGPVARFNNASINISTSISSSMLEAAGRKKNPTIANGVEDGGPKNLKPDEKLPWNVFANYGVVFTNDKDRVIHPTQTLIFSGDVMPTKFWKIGVTSGFDFRTQKLTYTSLNIYRDLKCWEARIDWVPFGALKSYRLVINLKTAMLRDFKIPKQNPPINNF